MNIFLKSYDPLEKIKTYFKDKTDLELVIVNQMVQQKLTAPGKNILDVFLIGEIDKDDFIGGGVLLLQKGKKNLRIVRR